MMKSLFIIFFNSDDVCQISGQKSPENIYRKYSQNSDYTTIFISGGIMKLINHFEDDDTLEAVLFNKNYCPKQ